MAPSHATQQEKSAFLDAAIQNPDTQVYGSPVDEVQGNSIVRKQTVSASLIGDLTANDTLDLYIVQWDWEYILGKVTSQGPITTIPTASYVVPGNDTTAVGLYTASAAQAGALWANARDFVECGGLMAYIMNKGESPFPASSGGVIGPCAPRKVVPLVFGSDMIGDCSRMIGSNFEVNYTAPEINAQGVWTQMAQPNLTSNRTESRSVFPSNTVDPSIAAFQTLVSDITTSQLFPGSPAAMIKQPGALQRPAYDGVLQNTRTDWSNNRPSYGLTCALLYLGGEDAPIAQPQIITGNPTRNLDLALHGTVQTLLRDPISGAMLNWITVAADCLIYPSNVGITIAHCQGLVGNFTMQLRRTATFESFVNPRSIFIAFSKPSPPADKATMESVENTLNATPQLWCAADNGLGKFSKLAKGIFKTTQVAVKTLAPGSKIDKMINLGVHTANQANQIMKGETRNRTKPASKQTNNNNTQVAVTGKRAMPQNTRDLSQLKSVLINMGWSEDKVNKLALKGRKKLQEAISLLD